MKCFYVFVLLLISFKAVAVDIELESTITKIARDRCNSEYKEGEDYTMEVLASGDVKISLLGRKGAGLDGSFIYKKGEWKGRPFVKEDDQALADDKYRKCVSEQSKELMQRYKPELQVSNPLGINGLYLAFLKENCPKGWTFANDIMTGSHRYKLCYTLGSDRYVVEIHNYGTEDTSTIFGWKKIPITGTRKTNYVRYASPDEMRNKGWYPSKVHISYSNNCTPEVTGKNNLEMIDDIYGKVNWTLCVEKKVWPITS